MITAFNKSGRAAMPTIGIDQHSIYMWMTEVYIRCIFRYTINKNMFFSVYFEENMLKKISTKQTVLIKSFTMPGVAGAVLQN